MTTTKRRRTSAPYDDHAGTLAHIRVPPGGTMIRIPTSALP